MSRISTKAAEWINSLCINGIIYEYRLPEDTSYSVDGYDPNTNTLYEFYGDYWHGNPNVYNGNDMNAHNKKKFKKLYYDTLKREEFLLSLGYKLVKAWESEWDNRDSHA